MRIGVLFDELCVLVVVLGVLVGILFGVLGVLGYIYDIYGYKLYIVCSHKFMAV